MEITEEDWNAMREGIKTIKKDMGELNIPENLVTKKDMELCIGSECNKLSGDISDLKKEQDHLSDLVHKNVKRPAYRPPAADIHARAKERAAAQEKEDTHSHPDVKQMIDCPTCYPGIREAIEPKLAAEGYRKGALKLSDTARKALKDKGIPVCTECGVPWEDENDKKCVNCGEGIDGQKEK